MFSGGLQALTLGFDFGSSFGDAAQAARDGILLADGLAGLYRGGRQTGEQVSQMIGAQANFLNNVGFESYGQARDWAGMA